MNYRSRLFYLGLNMLAPGIGQLALRWYLRGTLELLIFIAAIAWGFMELLLPIINYAMSDVATSAFPKINTVPLIIAIAAGVLVWLWSLVEIILFYNPPVSEDKNKNQDSEVKE